MKSNRIRNIGIFLIVGLGLTCVSLASPAAASKEKRLAVVIGNSAYPGRAALDNPGNDAELMGKAFRATGFETEVHFDLNEKKFGRILDELSERAVSYDVIAFYFAGHGIQLNGKNYLIPTDAQIRTEGTVKRETIALVSVMKILERVNVGLLFLDACRSNPFLEQIVRSMKGKARSFSLKRGLAPVGPTGNTLVAFATLPDMAASDGVSGNSPFAKSLAAHLTTPNVEVSVMMKRVTQDVYEATGSAQRPQQLSQMAKEFYFLRSENGEVASESDQTLLAVYPNKVGVGEELALIADVSPQCHPLFFNLTKSGKVTPIPLKYFKTISVSSTQKRYEISRGSRFGLMVLESDERGDNYLGFVCRSNSDEIVSKRNLVKSLSQQIKAGNLNGKIQLTNDIAVRFHFQSYTIN